jgi:hypothetical protein
MQMWRRDDRVSGDQQVPSIQLDSLGQQLAIWMYSFAGMDL